MSYSPHARCTYHFFRPPYYLENDRADWGDAAIFVLASVATMMT